MRERIAGTNEGVAVKAPVRVATTSHLVLLAGLLTVDGVTLATGDRVLVKNQSDPIDNGIYIAGTSAWDRAPDFDGLRDVVEGTIVSVNYGTTNGGRVFRLATANPVIGTSNLEFSSFSIWLPNVVMDGDADDTDAINDAISQAAESGGGIVELPVGVTAVSQIVLKDGVILRGQGPNATTIYGLYNEEDTGPVITWENAQNFQFSRAHAIASLTGGVSSNVTLRNVVGFAVGDVVLIASPTGWYAGSYLLATVNSVDTTTNILNVTTTTSGAVAIGDIFWNCNNVGPHFAGVTDLLVRGSRGLVNGVQNICQPQTRSGAGNLSLNGTFGNWMDGYARAPFLMNARVAIGATGDNSGKSITLTGYAIKADGTTVAVSESLAGPVSSTKSVYSTKLYNYITQVAIDGTPVGNIFLGFCGGGDGAGILTWGPGPILKNLFVQDTRGWGYELDWIYPVVGWSPANLKSQLGEISYVQGYLLDGGGMNVHCSVDGDIAHVTFNQFENQGVRLGRMAPGVHLRRGHVSAAYADSTRFYRHFEGVYSEADTARIDSMALEGASRGNLVILGNNTASDECRIFDPLSSPDAGGGTWVANPDATSPYTPTGIVFGDVTLGFAATKCSVRARSNNCAGGHVVMTSDGGENVIEVEARDQYTALTGGVSSGVTTRLPVQAIPTKMKVGSPIYIRLASGSWDTRSVSALRAATSSTVTMTIASPGVVSWTGHGLSAGDAIYFTTTGSLPTGVTAGLAYYVIATGLTADTFRFSATSGGSAVNTSGTQSGTHTCVCCYIDLAVAVTGNASAGAIVAKGLAISGSLKTTGSVDFLSRVRIDGLGTNNQAYRFNWYGTGATFAAEPYTGNGVIIQGRASDGQGTLIFGDGSGSGGLTGTTRATLVASSTYFQNIAASGLGFEWYVNGSTKALWGDSNGNVVVGSAALATNATNGFPWIPSMAGSPSGSPTSPYSNAGAIVVDTSNNRLYVRVGSTWRYAALT